MSLGHPAGVPGKMAFSVRFSIAINRTSLGHRPVEIRLSRRVSQGHPAGVPGIFLKFMCPFLSSRNGPVGDAAVLTLCPAHAYLSTHLAWPA